VQAETSVSGLAVLHDELERLLDALDDDHDGRYRVRALTMLARVHWTGGHVVRAQEVMQEALEEARRCDDGRQVGLALTQIAFYALIGPAPVGEAIDLCHRLLAEAGDDRPMRASVLKTLAGLHALRREFEQSRQLAQQSTELYEELGLRLAAAQASVEFAIRELLAGDPLAAEAVARRGYQVLESIGETSYQASCAAMLAQALHLQGLHHEAGRFAKLSEELSDAGDVISQSQWRAARAKVLAGIGQHDEALRLAHEAVDQLAGTDLLFLKGDALLGLAEVLRAAGRAHEAVDALEAAQAIHDRKGATGLRDHARRLMDELIDDELAQV
jgi:tetratricopeptide (TPR) repeat protein